MIIHNLIILIICWFKYCKTNTPVVKNMDISTLLSNYFHRSKTFRFHNICRLKIINGPKIFRKSITKPSGQFTCKFIFDKGGYYI